MNPLQNVVYFAVFLGVLVTVHELGHFLVAKACGVKVLKFSIGFGPRIFGFTKGETEYRVAWIPLGGYVKMAGEQPHDEVAPEDARRSFLNQPPWKRAAIVAAGPAFNLIFPILAYFVVNLIPTEVASTRIGYVDPDMPAAMAGLKPGDRIKSVEGREVKMFDELPDAFAGLFDKPVQIVYERDGQDHTTTVVPQKFVDSDPVEKIERGLIGVGAVPRAAVVGVPAGSAAETEGLKTFDRVAKVGDQATGDELQLREVVSKIPVGTPMELTLLRTGFFENGGAKFVIPDIVKVTVTRSEGEGFAALGGAEPGDLYVWNVDADSPAAKAGLKRGDRAVSIDSKILHSAQFMTTSLRNQDTKPFKFTWRSGGEEKAAEVQQVVVKHMDELKNEYDVLELGIWFRPVFAGRPDPLAGGASAEKITVKQGPQEAFMGSVKMASRITRKIALVIGKLFTGDVAFNQVGGPVVLYMVATKSAEAGIDSFMSSMAILSINLGLMNLLPIPVLDGFALLAAIWEGIRRRPIPIRAREYANMVGLAMLALLMVLVLKNDITRLLR